MSEPLVEWSTNDPRTWWRHVLRSVIGIRAKDYGPAKEYMAFVEQHRGPAVRDTARDNLYEYAASEAFDAAADMLHKLENPIAFRPQNTKPATTARRRR